MPGRNADFVSNPTRRKRLLRVTLDIPETFGSGTQRKIRIPAWTEPRLIKIAVSGYFFFVAGESTTSSPNVMLVSAPNRL